MVGRVVAAIVEPTGGRKTDVPHDSVLTIPSGRSSKNSENRWINRSAADCERAVRTSVYPLPLRL